MGTFDVACGISSLPINDGEEAGLFLLVPQNKYGCRPHDEPKVLTHPNDYFSAFLPPIYGTYNGYGVLENIRRTKTVELLENLFDRGIDVIMECLAPTHGMYSKYNRAFEHYSNTGVFVEPRLIDRLVSYGFTIAAEDDNEVVYQFKDWLVVYNKDKTDWMISRTHWEGGRMKVTGLNRFVSVEDVLEEFSKRSQLYPGFEEKHYWALHQLRSLNGMFFRPDVFEKFAPAVTHDDMFRNSFMNRAKAGWEEYSAEFLASEDKYPSVYNSKFDSSFRHSYDYPADMFRPMFETYKGDSSEIMEGYLLSMTVHAANRPLFPTTLGTQHGEDEVSRRLAEITLEILDARKKERDEW